MIQSSSCASDTREAPSHDQSLNVRMTETRWVKIATGQMYSVVYRKLVPGAEFRSMIASSMNRSYILDKLSDR